ncbi:T9SS type A sorting domain-containing protein, partial [bacterium AH-315-C07]|nr:T9SS type A sorting domain-containing protein [bacterium AH-315-C07]
MKLSCIIAITIIVATVTSAKMSISYSTGAPAGYTGSPSDDRTCAFASCHGGSATKKSNWITTDIPNTGYIPDNTYEITVAAVDTGRSKFGFSLSPQDENGNLIGVLISSNGTQTQNSKYITHSFGNTSGIDSKTWSFNWIAPSVADGFNKVTFYAAFNASDNKNTSTGDNIYTSTHIVSVDSSSATSLDDEIVAVKSFKVYPNPSLGTINVIQTENNSQYRNLRVSITDINGRIVYNMNLANKPVDLTTLPNGIYTVIISNKDIPLSFNKI